MSVEGFLEYVAGIRGFSGEEQKQRIDKMVDTCGLETVVKMDISELSKGFRQRVGLAQAMSGIKRKLFLPVRGTVAQAKSKNRTPIALTQKRRIKIFFFSSLKRKHDNLLPYIPFDG
jgi:ABC-2 type transport system ATP-binding protein